MNRMTSSLAGVGVVALALSAPAAASAVEINCPVNQVRREITTPLPGGWWNTPIVNSPLRLGRYRAPDR